MADKVRRRNMQIWPYCIVYVFGVIVMLKNEAFAHEMVMVNQNLLVLSCIHNSINFDSIANTTG